MGKARGGFTLIEVMVALVIIATVATASLKLCALSAISLSEVKEKRELLRDASAIKTQILFEEIAPSGTNGDIEWDCISGKRDIMGDDFGTLYLGETKAPINLDIEWRDLKVTKNYTPDRQRSIILCIEKENIKTVIPTQTKPESSDKKEREEN